MNKILISACFLGEKVRYDGDHNKLIHEVIKQWQLEDRFIAICPEIAGGLAVPRPPAEIQKNYNLVIDINGNNVTNEFNQGAKKALTLCQTHNIEYALLKESSPSCGSLRIYDGTFTNIKIQGQGMTTTLLRRHGIKVFSEVNIERLISEIKRVEN